MTPRRLLGRVADLLEAHPERWAQVFFVDKHRGVGCLAGWMYTIASEKVNGKDANPGWVHTYGQAVDALHVLVQRDRPQKKNAKEWRIGQWNDAPGRTVDQVVAICREAMEGFE